jgi:hypothetical protein
MSSNSVVAMQAAEAGLARVQAELNVSPTYGTVDGEKMTGTLAGSGASWEVKFNNTSPGPGDSVNNLTGTEAISRSDGTIVPPYTADIIVSTNVASPNRNIPKVGCVMTNTWLMAIASSGTLTARGALEVYGASSLNEAQKVLNGTSTGDLPGKLAANSAGNPSVDISGQPLITGSVVTPGVALGNFSKISGVTPIPKYLWAWNPVTSGNDVTQLNPKALANQLSSAGGKSTFYCPEGATFTSGLTLTNCTVWINGDCNVQGGLNLVNSTIYVNGDLTISGGIKDNSGSGSCTGSIYICGSGNRLTLNGASTLAVNNSKGIAIYSAGDVNLGANATIQGIVYADGNINANGSAIIVGAVIANGNSTTEIDVGGGAKFIYCSEYAQSVAQQLKMQKLSWRIIETN